MIHFIIFVLAALLALRALLLFFYEKKGMVKQVARLILILPLTGISIYFLSISSWNASPLLKGICSILLVCLVALPLYSRLKSRSDIGFSPIKILSMAVFFTLAAVLYLHSLLFRFTDDKAVLKIAMTGRSQQKWVEWKNPQGELKREQLTCYEVNILTREEKPLGTFFLYGDLCAVRAKILRFHPWLNNLGIENLYHVEAVYNGYKNPSHYNLFPVEANAFSFPEKQLIPWKSFFWEFWTRAFSDYYTSKWMKSASWESNYFPLTDAQSRPFCGSFYLTITPGGLSCSRVFPAENLSN